MPSKRAAHAPAPQKSNPPRITEKGKRQASSHTPASNAPLGWLALHLLGQWRAAGLDGLTVICASEQRAEHLGAIIHALDPDAGVMVLPSLRSAPDDDIEPSPEIAGRRSSVLRRLAEQKSVLLVSTAEALSIRVPSPMAMQTSALRFQAGAAFDVDGVRSFLVSAGYLVDERIESPGTAMFLGQALEIFPAGALMPVRIGYQAGHITDMHAYSLEDQRDGAALDEVVVDVVDEVARSGEELDDADTRSSTVAVFDYFPTALVVVDHGVDDRARRWFDRIGRVSADGYLSLGAWTEYLCRSKTVVLSEFESWPDAADFFKNASPAKSFRKFLALQREGGRRVVYTAATKGDLRAMDRRAGIKSTLCNHWRQATEAAQDRPAAILADLDRGFVSEDGCVVVAASDLLGSRAAHQDIMAVSARREISASTLSFGDAVIHMDRGMAILRGLTTVNAEGVADAEMIRLEFADEEQVLLPLSDLRALWHYSSEADRVDLDRADGRSWHKRRVKAESDIASAALHIKSRIEERNERKATPLVPRAAQYEAFAAGFGYLPTVDQGRAIADVLKDLASDRPMDRLIGGDVGYGKTEIALRAAAASVFAGKQVAVAVPTTVLARQHLETFRRRFEAFGVKVELLSRFTSTSDARAIKKQLADGSLSVVIGTHTLAGKAVRFKDLGLLVIDEEQHFGLAQKAKLAALADGLHLLTMTATPIPRTMSEAQAGLRSLSIIATAPVRRMPVKTTVGTFHDATVASALRREHRRRGQSFLVCPRIEDIAFMEKRLGDLVPDLKIVVLHGKMPAADIDNAMLQFAAGEADILLATNIIESGLDLPRANTMVVWRPDKFGLAQLHQLRGRVGRRATRAFALFLTDPDGKVTGAAAKRLETLRKFDASGSGFLISASDLDLRGGGDLGSDKQSGHIQLLGPDLSAHLLHRALGSAKHLFDPRPEVRSDIPALLPDSYIQDETIRLELYSRIFRCKDAREIEAIEDEIEERFGDPPQEAHNLLGLARFELDCIHLGITSVEAGPRSIAVTFASEHRKLPARFDDDDDLTWKDGRLIFKRASTPAARMAALSQLVELVTRCNG
jgi:transcription-repair coupling factor (superfamily II helicase)